MQYVKGELLTSAKYFTLGTTNSFLPFFLGGKTPVNWQHEQFPNMV